MSFVWGPVQLMIAAIMFMLTIQHDSGTRKRIYIIIAVTAALYLILPIQIWKTKLLIWQCFWGCFIALSIVFVKFCLRCNWKQAAYCLSCALALQHIFWCFKMAFRTIVGATNLLLPEMLIMVLVYAAIYSIFARRLFKSMYQDIHAVDLVSMPIILMFVFGLNARGNSGSVLSSLAYLIADGTCCYYILWVQAMKQEQVHLQKERDSLEFMISQQRSQYEITQNMIDRINQRCHDIKHQLRAAGYAAGDEGLTESLKTLADNVMVYDMAIRTGNKALDTVLMEKGLTCKEQNIQWVCMADGAMVSFIHPADIYAIFGNLLDNAIEAVLQVPEEEKRVINVRILSHESLTVIQIENFYEGKLVFDGELPVTTKTDKEEHGFGMKSVDYLVKKYGGTMVIETEDQVFRVKIMIPVV